MNGNGKLAGALLALLICACSKSPAAKPPIEGDGGGSASVITIYCTSPCTGKIIAGGGGGEATVAPKPAK